MYAYKLVRETPDWPTFSAMLRAREGNERPALEAWRGAAYSYAEVTASARSVAAFLTEKGLAPGDKVILYSDNAPEWMITYFGARLAGITLVPLDCQLGSDAVANLAAFSEARLIVADTEREQACTAGVPVEVVSLDRASPSFDTMFRRTSLPEWSALPETGPDDVAAIIFTSGTTGDPKGVELTERNLMSNAQTCARIGILDETDSMAVVLPLHHAYAFTVGSMTPFVLGGRVVYPGTLKGDLIRQCLAEREITILPAVPLLLELMSQGIERTLASRPWPLRLFVRIARALPFSRFLLGSIRRKIGPKLRLIVSAGAALPAPVNQFFLDLGFLVVEGYGLTETAPAVALTPQDAPRPGTVGFPIPGAELKFGEARADGSAEIMVRGPLVMRGYHKRPDLTREVFDGEFFRTGDLGRVDEDGYLWITGRAKEIIVLPSGKNIYPEEVEHHYLKAPSVKEICVVEDSHGAESLHALIVPAEEAGQAVGEGLRARIQYELEDLSKELPTYQRISGFTLTTEELPRTRLGKLRRGEVAERLVALASGKRTAQPVTEDEEQLIATEAGKTVMQVLEEIAGRPVQPTEHLELDLGLDSLRRLEVLARIEGALGVQVDMDVAAGITRPVEIVALLKKAGVS